MRKNEGGYIYVNLLLVFLIVLSFFLSGGLILSEEVSPVDEIKEKYTLVDKEPQSSNSTLQLSTLNFIAQTLPVDPLGQTLPVDPLGQTLPVNPPLTQVCRNSDFDIVLVIDDSESITSANDENKDYSPEIKSALNTFVNSFLTTSTQFSVIKFASTAIIIKEFTDDNAQIESAINKDVHTSEIGDATNWQDALEKARNLIKNQKNISTRLESQDYIIFVSDGNPNRVGDGASRNDPVPVNYAVDVADKIKQEGAKIITFGIGSSISQENLRKISGSIPSEGSDEDVIMTNFADFGVTFQNLSTKICEP